MRETINQLRQMVEGAKKSGDFSALSEFCLSAEYQALPYAVKNYHFVTSSKLKSFEQCQLAYRYEYIDLIPKPESMEDADHFLVGRAFDDLATFGAEEWAKRYEVVSRRGKDSEKVQLTGTMGRLVDQMAAEFRQNLLFNHTPQKKVYFAKYGEHILKAELDDETTDYIIDLKTAANVTTFEPEMYDVQAAFYHFIVEEATMERKPVRLEVVDKFAHFSRSRLIEFTVPSLQARRGRIIALLDELAEAQESGIWMQTANQRTMFNSPYYGHEGYGRPTEPEYF